MVRLITLALFFISLALTAAFANSPDKTIREKSLFCISDILENIQSVMVYYNPNFEELDVNGSIHYIEKTKREPGLGALYTYRYHDKTNQLVYLTLITVNEGENAGMYLMQYDALTNDPLFLVKLHCHKYEDK